MSSCILVVAVCMYHKQLLVASIQKWDQQSGMWFDRCCSIDTCHAITVLRILRRSWRKLRPSRQLQMSRNNSQVAVAASSSNSPEGSHSNLRMERGSLEERGQRIRFVMVGRTELELQ